MLFGNYGSTSDFSDVTMESAAKYSVDDAALIMTMECAELLNDAFMEGFYEVNDIEIEAAMEGYSSVQESSEKLASIKEKMGNARHKIAEAFRNMGKAIRAFFSNIVTKLKERMLKSNKFFNSLPGEVKVVRYMGHKFTHLEDIKAILNRIVPEEVLGSIDGYRDIVSNAKKDEDPAPKFKEEAQKKIDELKKEFGLDKEGSASSVLYSYFRNGAKWTPGASGTEPVTMSVSDMQKIIKAGSKIASDFDTISKGIESDYKGYADKCESLKGDSEVGTTGWQALAAMSRQVSTMCMTIAKEWCSAYNNAQGQWTHAIREYMPKDTKAAIDKDGWTAGLKDDNGRKPPTLRPNEM